MQVKSLPELFSERNKSPQKEVSQGPLRMPCAPKIVSGVEFCLGEPQGP